MKTWQRLKQNPGLWDKYLIREKVVDEVRFFFKKQGFHEAETPIMVPVPSCEPNLEVFETKLVAANNKQSRAFLRMSPEYALKKLIAAGIGNCFEIAKVFRNSEDISPSHNSEFTMLEWYRINASYLDIMKDFESLFLQLVKSKSLNYQGIIYDLSTPWLRVSVTEVIKKYAQIPFSSLINERGLINAAKNKGYQVNHDTSWEEVFYQIYFNEIEPELLKLKKPYFLYDYPLQQASLARKKLDQPELAERFEVFLAGVELGNCFSELIDPVEQEQRFRQEIKERKLAGKTEYPIDQDLINALKSGLPETAGIAVGLDRLIMLIANTTSIGETMFFPEKDLFDL